jgi:hypothetical protein
MGKTMGFPWVSYGFSWVSMGFPWLSHGFNDRKNYQMTSGFI